MSEAIRQLPGFRLGGSFILMAILLLIGLPTRAQQGGLDYYAPRTTSQQIGLFNSVEHYHLGPGRAKMAKGQYDPALGDFDFILRYYPNHPQALSLLSELCLKWKSLTCNAEGRFQKAIERNPDAATTYVVYAIHLHRNKRLDEAVNAYQRAIELEPNSLNAHYNLGLAYVDLKQYDLANQHAQKSYQLGASLPGLRNKLQTLGKWNPDARMPASDAKPAGEPSPEAEKRPN